MVRRARRPATAGVAAGTTAGLVWGLAFLLPVLLHGWTAVTITLGRYLAYGAVSLILFFLGGVAVRRMAVAYWRPAILFAITGNVGYYLLLVLGIQLVGAPVTDIVIGCIPVVLALVANVSTPTYTWRALCVPTGLVVAGLLLVNLDAFAAPARHGSVLPRVLGVLAACAADALWTWYGLANARFLQRHPDVTHAAWSTVVGLGTGAITVVTLPLALAWHQVGQTERTSAAAVSVAALAGGCLVLGVIVSWAATSLWNLTSARLSTTAAGMLVNVESISGYGYVYAASARWPPVVQLAGLVLIVIGVVIVVRLRPRASAPAVTEVPLTPGERSVDDRDRRRIVRAEPTHPDPAA